MKVCHKCGAPWQGERRQLGVKECCEKCSAYLHCCLNCTFHDRSKPNQCRVPHTETVADRARANFCDDFEFKATGGAAKDTGKAAALEKLGALFGDEKEKQPGLSDLFGAEPEKKPRSFEDLFGG